MVLTPTKADELLAATEAAGSGRRGSFQLRRNSPPNVPATSSEKKRRKSNYTLPVFEEIVSTESTPLVRRLESTEWRSGLSKAEVRVGKG